MCRFIPTLVELLEQFFKLLKKNASFRWGKVQRKLPKKSKLSSPLTMISRVEGLLLTLHLTSTNTSFGVFRHKRSRDLSIL